MTDLRQHGDGEVSTHAELLLCGSYLLGGLEPDQASDFERHLATCAVCLDECDRLAPVAVGFAGMDADTIESLLAEPWPPISAAVDTAIVPNPASVHDRPPVHEEPRVGGADPRTGGSARPGLRQDASTRPGSRKRRRRLALGAFAAVVVVAIGVGVVVHSATGGDRAPIEIQRVDAATAEGQGTTSHLSVLVTVQGGTSVVRATVVGLQSGTEYRLYTVDNAGANHLVVQWTAGGGTQDVGGRTEVPLDDLAFFSVTTAADDAAVVSARVVRAPPTR